MEKLQDYREKKPALLHIILPLLIAFVLGGCAQRPVVFPYPGPVQRDVPPEIVRPEPVVPKIVEPEIAQKGPGAPLYRKAQKFIAEKNYEQAELALERALRIEPKNGYYWYTLAQAKFGQQQYGKTVQLCLKSKSLAGGDRRLIDLNEMLMEKAQ